MQVPSAAQAIVLLHLFLCLTLCQDCRPFGVRLNYGAYYNNQSSNQKLGIRFDTKSVCQRSYITIQKNSTVIVKIYCDSSKLEFDQYVTYVHKCSIVDIQEGDNILYMVYGWTGKPADPQIPYLKKQISYRFPMRNQQFKMINVADWSYLRDLKDKYKPLDKSFEYLLNNDKNIYALFINGDMAYDLQSNKGRNYEDFLNMISQVSIKWPLIINAGNHQHRDNNSYIMSKTFQTYEIAQKRVVQLKFPWFNFILFDPYQILYNKQAQNVSYPSYSAQLNRAYQQKKLTVLASHYPFRCNGIPSDCVTKHQKISTFFSAMFDANVPLYLGAHHHAYERHYPFKKNGTYIKKQRVIWNVQSKVEQRTMISVVEGVAGNDVYIDETYEQLQDFTAAVSYNVTGFGLLKINQGIMGYSHYTTNDIQKPLDEFQIILRRYVMKNIRVQ